jgi:hypothetical protein
VAAADDGKGRQGNSRGDAKKKLKDVRRRDMNTEETASTCG